MRMSPPLFLSMVLASAPPLFAASQIYRYTDDTGTINFTTELRSIPEAYRRHAVPLYMDITSAAGAVTPHAQPVPASKVTVSSDYRMGAHDSRSDAIRMAVESAKRQALEQAATYLETVTEVKHFELTRDELRSYSAGSLTVLDQQTSTRNEDGAHVIHVDLTAQVDREEVIAAIKALREHESVRSELIALRAETDQLRQQLDAATRALALAPSREQIEALIAERQKVLDQMQAQALVSQAWISWLHAAQGSMVPPLIGGLIFQAQQLHPSNRHLGTLQQAVMPQPPVPPASSPAGTTAAQPHEGTSIQRLHSALATPSLPSPLAAPLLQPTFPQIQPLGVPHGSLTQTPSLSAPLQSAPPAQPTFPQLQPLGVPHGSLSLPSTAR